MSQIQDLSDTLLDAQIKVEKQTAIIDSISHSYFDYPAVNASCDLKTEEGKHTFDLLNDYPQAKLIISILSDYTDGLAQLLKDAQDGLEQIIEQSKSIREIL